MGFWTGLAIGDSLGATAGFLLAALFRMQPRIDDLTQAKPTTPLASPER